MKRLRNLAGGAVLAAAIVGCGGTNGTTLGTNPAYGPSSMPMDSSQQQQAVSNATQQLQKGTDAQLAAGLNQFGMDMFQKVAKAQPDENVCVSPVSVGSVLGVLYNGSTGDTQKQIAKTLAVNKLSESQVEEGNKSLQALLQNIDPKKVDLDIANSVWVNSGNSLAMNTVQKDYQDFNAKVSTLDFTAPTAPSSINDWVKDSTKGKIATIITQIPTNAQLYVVDAVYFNGSWQRPFNKQQTVNADFTLSDGTTKEQVPTMNESGSFSYFTNSDVSCAALPYGSGRLEMDVLVPNGSQTLAGLEKKMSINQWNDWAKSFKSSMVQISMPSFQSQYAMTLNDTLKSLGITDAFDSNKANFSAMLQQGSASSTQKLYLSDVKHKTFINVNEEGTEAAATTSAQISATAVLATPIRLAANKPFLYMIRDSQTGVILFTGTVVDPKLKDSDGDAKPDDKKATQSSSNVPSPGKG